MTLAGNRELLDRLVSEHLEEAFRFALRLCGRAEAAEEIVRESLYRAARYVGSFRGESQFRTWFYRIIITAFHDHLAAEARRRCQGELNDELPDPHSADPAATTMIGELGELVAERISALPPRQREVLVLIAYQGMRPREVAEALGISESSVNTNLHHARARLRAELGPYLAET